MLDAETKQPVPNGPVVAKVNGTVVGTGEVVDGNIVIPTDLDKIGSYDVELEYLGNENYTISNTTIPVYVVGRVADITEVPDNTTLGSLLLMLLLTLLLTVLLLVKVLLMMRVKQPFLLTCLLVNTI